MNVTFLNKKCFVVTLSLKLKNVKDFYLVNYWKGERRLFLTNAMLQGVQKILVATWRSENAKRLCGYGKGFISR
jgi:hypothetical protein